MTVKEIERNAVISLKILALKASGLSLKDAWNQVLGSVKTYEQFVSELYDELRAKGMKVAK